MLSAREEKVLEAVSGQRAHDHVAAQVALGEKVSGSPQEQQAARLIKDALSPWVDACDIEGVPAIGYLRKRGLLRLLSPATIDVPCEVNPLSASGRGEVVLVGGGNGTRGDYDRGEGWVGKAVLVTNDAARRGAMLTHLALEAKYRGVACLIYHLPGMREDVIPIWPVDVSLPVLSISNREEVRLRQLLSEGVEVRVSFEACLEEHRSATYNVVGTVWGSRYPEEVVYLTGHYDSWFVGANDNASTVACMLEAARTLKEYRPQRTLRFIAWGSEESGGPIGEWGLYGLVGSYGYGQRHAQEMDGEGREVAVAMVNGEMLGFTPRTHLQCTPELLPLTQSVAADMGGHLRASGPSHNWTLSDHLCFHAMGVPLIYLIPARDLGSGRRSPYWNVYHTADDNMDIMSLAALEENSRLMALTMMRLDRAARPYSLDSMARTVMHGAAHLPNGRRLGRALASAQQRCRGKDRAESLRRERRLTGLLNRRIYVMDRPFGLKFPLMLERISRLQEAVHILEIEGDTGRARSVLASLADFSVADSFSPEAVAMMQQVRRDNLVLNSLGLIEENWVEVLACFDKKKPVSRIVAALKAKIEDLQEMLKLEALSLEKA
ncbi:MAG: M28 family metallopeptidase, partial [Dehalococcoidia bacterium]|nr:M28 family metallopeptidase [Dehalococcoidia bacterium]